MLKLKAEKREVFGKKLKPIRATGKLPVVIYGREEAARSFFVNTSEFKKVLEEAGESTVIAVDTGAGETRVLIHDVDTHPVTGQVIHADLYAFSKSQTLKLHVPIEFIGVAPASKEAGVTLLKVLYELEIESLPENLPPKIEVDLSALTTVGTHIVVKDVIVPVGVKILDNPEQVIIAANLVEEEKEEEVAPIDLSAIEVEKRGKEEPTEGEAVGEAKPE